eukprot:3437510-Pleurochrysis_carterae.AAC.1
MATKEYGKQQNPAGSNIRLEQPASQRLILKIENDGVKFHYTFHTAVSQLSGAASFSTVAPEN